MSRKRDVFQLDNNDTSDADTSDAVGWSRDDGLGYGILPLSKHCIYRHYQKRLLTYGARVTDKVKLPSIIEANGLSVTSER